MQLLRTITAWVDKDVARTGSPISLLVVVLPWIPFILFVEGPPAEAFPVLSAAALIASIGWSLFVFYRLLRYVSESLGRGPGSRRVRMVVGTSVVTILGLGLLWPWLFG